MPSEALGPMAMNVPYPDPRNYGDILRYVNVLALPDTRSEFLHIGAVDVIKANDAGYLVHVVLDSICKRVIHVHLPVSWLLLHIGPMEASYRSPF